MTTIEAKRVLGLGRSAQKSSMHNSIELSSLKSDTSVSIPDHSCGLTMLYLGPPMMNSSGSYKFKIHADEILILQSHTETGTKSVFKGCVKPDESFTFKSCRLIDHHFAITIYINGIIEQHIFVCCEKGFLNQSHFERRWNSCQLQSITGGISCQTCQYHELMNFPSYDDIEYINAQTLASSTKDMAKEETLVKPVFGSSTKSKSNIGITNDDDKQNLSQDSNVPTYNQTGDASKTEKSTNIEQPKNVHKEEINQQDNQSIGKLKTSKHTMAGFKQPDLNIDSKIMNEDKTDQNMTKKNVNEDKKARISPEAKLEMDKLLERYLPLLIPQAKSNETEKMDKMKSSTNIAELKSTTDSSINPHSTGTGRDAKATIQCTNSTSMSGIENTAESFVLIWLDETIQKNKDTIESEQKLRAIVNSLVTCRTISETTDTIKQVQDQQIYLIVSGDLGKQLLPMSDIFNSQKLNSIYIFCRDQHKYTDLAQSSAKVRGIFVEIDPLCKCLKEDTEQALKNLLPISTTTEDSTDEKNQTKFLCSQLHRELLFTMEYNNNAKLELTEFCSEIYKSSPAELRHIDQMRIDYHAGKAISWYTQPTFLYKMLNKAFLTQNITILCKFRFFIRDLHMHLAQMHSLYKPSLKSRVFPVYRGLSMSLEDFKGTIRAKINELIAFDSFLSTSLDVEVAKRFALEKHPPKTESVVFHMEINPDQMGRPFADISQWSEFKEEQEVLFSIGAVFRIVDVADEKTSDGIWIVRLSTVSEDDEQLQEETQQIQITLLEFFKSVLHDRCKDEDYQNIPASNANVASMYFKQEEYNESLTFYKKALDTLNDLKSPDPSTKATYISNVAKVHLVLGHEHEALDLYKEALDIRHNICEPNDPSLIQTIHIIGHIYQRRKNWNEAFKQYNQALELLQSPVKSRLPSDPPSIAVTHICIGNIFHHQQKYSEALKAFSKALKEQLEHLPNEHPVLAFLYNNIGAMHYKMKQYDLALKNQLECLTIELKALSKEHKTFAETYKNIATTYEKLQKFDDAFEFAQKCVDQLKLYSSEGSEELNDAMDLLKRIQISRDNRK